MPTTFARSTVRGCLRTGGAALAYAGFGVCGAIMGRIVLPLAVRTIPDPQRAARRAQEVISKCSRLYLSALAQAGLLGFEPPAETSIDPEHAGIIIANHPSLLDIILILAACPRMTFVAKASWFRNPIVGPLLRYGHHIAGPEGGPQGGPQDGAVVFSQVLQRLEAGELVMLFPEGTRSPPGELGPFKRGAFEAAIRSQCPIYALLIRVTPHVLSKGRPWWDVPQTRVDFRLHALTTVKPQAYATSTARALCRDIHRRYVAALTEGLERPQPPTTSTSSQKTAVSILDARPTPH